MKLALPIFAISVLFTAPEAAAYVGPGLGLGALGAAAGLLLSLVLALIALCWYPVKRLLRGRAARRQRQ